MKGGVEWGELRSGILGRVTPDGAERRAVEAFCKRTVRGLTARLRDADLEAAVEVHGSVARDTWLSGERDIDVFIILDPGYGLAVIPRVLNAIKAYVGEGWVEAYAEHPYIQATIDGFRVEFVPCFRVDPGEGLISATDRTPLHTRFVKGHLAHDGGAEVRLLKRFMRGIGVYGAEVKVGGFSGYLCELLIIRFGSLDAVLDAAAGWRRGEVIDVIGDADPKALRKRFRDPLILVDPVDLGRNAASAVSDTAMWTFTAAARSFMREPKEAFFYPSETVVNIPALLEDLNIRESSLLFVVVEDGEVDVPDVLWGQLYRAEKAIMNLLRKREFHVIRSAAWSDEESEHIFLFELESAAIPGVVRSMGPPVEMAESSRRFLRAHLRAENTVSGPWIEGRRWWVEARRQYTDARALLTSALEDGGRGVGIPRRLSVKIARGHEVLMDGEIADHLRGDFTRFLDGFLRGRPGWIE